MPLAAEPVTNRGLSMRVSKAAAGEPPLAVLVVRESDGLPGQGWWVGRADWHGRWTGDAATVFVRSQQRTAFDYWRAKAAISSG